MRNILKKATTKYLLSALLLLLFSGVVFPVRPASAEEAELSEFHFPDDPYLDSLWAFENPGYYTHYYGTFPVSLPATEGIDLNLWEAWRRYPLKKEETRTIVVAIIDTGIDYQHPDLRDQMWVNPNEIPGNGIDDDGNGYVDDIHGWDFYHNDASICHYVETTHGFTADPDDNDNHGTHIAGILAATANNSIGIAGAASNINIRIMSLKIHGGTSSSGSVTNAIKAIRYAEEMGADICNLSWGTLNYNEALEIAIRESSMLFVTAAGNNGINNNSTPVFPASLRLDNLISVAYIDADGILDPASNYGVSTVDIAAPGYDIYSTLVGSYGYSSGSSMAAPYVTALAAMVYAYQDYVYPAQVKEMIINTMQPLSTLDGYLIHPGIPDAAALIDSLSLLQADTSAPFLILDSFFQKDVIRINIAAFDSGGSGIRRLRYVYGTKSADYFLEGGGTAILDSYLSLTKAGYYTFYVEDCAGNYNMYNHYIEEDTLAPEFISSYTVAPDYTYKTVSFSVSDADSGVRSIKYLAGEHDETTFLNTGESLDTTLPSHSLYLMPGIEALTVYTEDYRGNSAVYVIYPEIIPASSLYLTVTERTLPLAETFQLSALLFPWLTTDQVWYQSLDTSVAQVDQFGYVTAAGEGETFIQVSSNSGVAAFCKIVVPVITPEPPVELTN
ncbi:MAG: S8 family serine peptidase [Lachnospiraceae bacterium]|nr:S8 family serine peptidase [Lachnospiraceae bacterium]